MAETWHYAVTFESDTQQPVTVRGRVAGSLSAAVGPAVRLAKQRKSTKNRYRSVVVLVSKVEMAAQAKTGSESKRAA